MLPCCLPPSRRAHPECAPSSSPEVRQPGNLPRFSETSVSTFSCISLLDTFLAVRQNLCLLGECGVMWGSQQAGSCTHSPRIKSLRLKRWEQSLSCSLIVSLLCRELSEVFISLSSFRSKTLPHCSVKSPGKPTYYGGTLKPFLRLA